MYHIPTISFHIPCQPTSNPCPKPHTINSLASAHTQPIPTNETLLTVIMNLKHMFQAYASRKSASAGQDNSPAMPYTLPAINRQPHHETHPNGQISHPWSTLPTTHALKPNKTIAWHPPTLTIKQLFVLNASKC